MRYGFDAESVRRGDAETRLWTRTHLPSFVELNPPVHALSRVVPCVSAPWRLCVETNPGVSRVRAVVLNGSRGMLFNCVQEVGSTRLFRQRASVGYRWDGLQAWHFEMGSACKCRKDV